MVAKTLLLGVTDALLASDMLRREWPGPPLAAKMEGSGVVVREFARIEGRSGLAALTVPPDSQLEKPEAIDAVSDCLSSLRDGDVLVLLRLDVRESPVNGAIILLRRCLGSSSSSSSLMSSLSSSSSSLYDPSLLALSESSSSESSSPLYDSRRADLLSL